MLPGINHNIRYQDRVFHVQTEDLGVRRGRCRTHVFLNGSVIAEDGSAYGSILDGIVGLDDRTRAVRRHMQDLHKRCLKALVAGDYDPAIERTLAPAPPPQPDSAPPPPETASPNGIEEIDIPIEVFFPDDDEELVALLDLFAVAEREAADDPARSSVFP